MTTILPLEHLPPQRFDSPVILKKLALASRKLAELKGVAASIPNQGILINTLGMQEAKDSSAIENIVTTHDQLFQDELFPENLHNAATKEVLRYRQALRVGFAQVLQSDLITINHIIQIQAELEQNNAGFRKLPGTALKDGAGHTVYTPPQDPEAIITLMRDLERFINDNEIFVADPLIKMALIHPSLKASTRSTMATAAPDASSTCSTWSRKACSTFRCFTSVVMSYAPNPIITACCKPCVKTMPGKSGCSTCSPPSNQPPAIPLKPSTPSRRH